MHEDRLTPGRSSSSAGHPGHPRRVRRIVERLDIETLDRRPADALELNEIGSVELETDFPLAFDPRRVGPGTGSLILVDRIGNWSMAAGMIRGAHAGLPLDRSTGLRRRTRRRVRPVSPEERGARYGHERDDPPDGPRGEGKTHLALLERPLRPRPRRDQARRLTMRRGLNRDLGLCRGSVGEPSPVDGDREVVNDEGLLCIAAFVAPGGHAGEGRRARRPGPLPRGTAPPSNTAGRSIGRGSTRRPNRSR